MLLLPRSTRLRRLEGAHTDDLEALTRKTIKHTTYGRSLLPAGQSFLLPEHDEQAIFARDRQVEFPKRNHGSLRDALRRFF